jgi:hypothetical protein
MRVTTGRNGEAHDEDDRSAAADAANAIVNPFRSGGAAQALR